MLSLGSNYDLRVENTTYQPQKFMISREIYLIVDEESRHESYDYEWNCDVKDHAKQVDMCLIKRFQNRC